MALILMDLAISIDDYIVNRIHFVESHIHGYVGNSDRTTIGIYLSLPVLFSNVFMGFKPVARRFVVFHLVLSLYQYWCHISQIEYNQSWAESYAEEWVKKNL